MTELQDGHVLERIIRVHGVEGAVVVTVSSEGLSFRIKGSKKSVSVSWTQAIQASHTGTQVPSYLFGKPYELLQHMAAEVQKRRDKKDK